jgi:hypothetical protein
MNLETPNGSGYTGYEHRQDTLTLEQAALKRWLTTEVDLRVPRWAIVAASCMPGMLLLIALD